MRSSLFSPNLVLQPICQIKAMMVHAEKMRRLRTGFKNFNEWLERIENAQQAPQPHVPYGGRRGRVKQREVEEEFEDLDENDYKEKNNMRFGGNVRRIRGGREDKNREDRNREDGNVGSIKMKVPSFQGTTDLKVYFEWETKVKFVFDYHNYNENKKVKPAAAKFLDYAVVWQDQVVSSRRQNGERQWILVVR